MRYRRQFLFSILVIMLVVSGCNLLGGGDQLAVDATLPEPGIGVIPTAFDLAPTLAPGTAVTATPAPVGPTPEEGGNADNAGAAPTPLPEPTQIVPDVAPTDAPAAAPASGGGDDAPGIFIAPQLGAAEEIILVSGVNWPPNVKVSLHWAEPGGETGPVYWEEETDENGRFEVGLIVPPTEKWPGGEPQERDMIELRAMTPSLEYQYYWATYTYIPASVSSLVLPFTNPDYPYSISVPNLWTWYWDEDDTTDVRFSSPYEVGYGFALVVSGSSAESVVAGIMAQEAPGESYTTGNLSTSGYPGIEATTAGGTVVQFIEGDDYIYVISFTNDDGQTAYNILDTFTLN
ncbi:MAG: hypothetical protein JXJ17_15475 [Anaerolineae bacterium]|nr:hypothetical protein [Anaerolineae bacterium]